MSGNLARDARIIGAIARKDIGDAISNRTTLSIIIGTLMILFSSMALPMLLRLNQVPAAVVYDPGRSTLIRALTTREEFRLRLVASQDDLTEAVSGSAVLRLGLTIPDGLVQTSGTADPVTIEAVVPHWADPVQALELVAFFEEQLSEATWREVHITIADTPVYPAHGDMGQHSMSANTIAITTLTLGLALVPGLLTEEKEHHTLEVLLVSPARYGQIVLGKAITGMLYGSLAASLAVAVNAKWFVHGWLTLVAVLLGVLFTVAVGLLMGLLIDNPSSTNLWMGLVLLILLLPAFMGSLISENSSGLLQTAIRWVPTSSVSSLLAASMRGSVIGSGWQADVEKLVISTLVITVLSIWQVRRLETKAR